MHEMTMAREIARKVTREAEKANAKSVEGIALEVGDLAFLDTEAMKMWVQQALADSCARNASVSIDIVSSTLSCAACGFQGSPEVPEYHDHHLPLPPLPCPRCASSDVRLDVRNECILKRIELEI